MKKILLFMMLVISIKIQAQEALSYTEVIPAEGMSIQEINNTARSWFVSNFKSANDVLQIQEGNLLVGKGNFDYRNKTLTYAAASGFVSFVVRMQIREGRFKVEIIDFRHTSLHAQYGDWWSMGLVTTSPFEGKGKQGRKVYEDLYPICENRALYLIESLKEYFANKAVRSDDENW